jgi:hypothetical protein
MSLIDISPVRYKESTRIMVFKICMIISKCLFISKLNVIEKKTNEIIIRFLKIDDTVYSVKYMMRHAKQETCTFHD